MDNDNHLHAPPSHETWDRGLPFLDICDVDLTVEQLGQAIVTNNEAGLAAGKEAENRLVAAGRLLIEGQIKGHEFRRLPEGSLQRSQSQLGLRFNRDSEW